MTRAVAPLQLPHPGGFVGHTAHRARRTLRPAAIRRLRSTWRATTALGAVLGQEPEVQHNNPTPRQRPDSTVLADEPSRRSELGASIGGTITPQPAGIKVAALHHAVALTHAVHLCTYSLHSPSMVTAA